MKFIFEKSMIFTFSPASACSSSRRRDRASRDVCFIFAASAAAASSIFASDAAPASSAASSSARAAALASTFAFAAVEEK